MLHRPEKYVRAGLSPLHPALSTLGRNPACERFRRTPHPLAEAAWPPHDLPGSRHGRLPHLALGDHAAANAVSRDSVLPAFYHPDVFRTSSRWPPRHTTTECWRTGPALAATPGARNLHRCAQGNRCQTLARFPRTAAQINGTARYQPFTAAAISAFAFGQRQTIPGQQREAGARCFGAPRFSRGKLRSERELWTLAGSLLPASDIELHPRHHGSGASICVHSQPRCSTAARCRACVAQARRRAELTADSPAAQTSSLKGSALSASYRRAPRLLNRPQTGIWGGLLALPENARMLASAWGCHPAALLPCRAVAASPG